MALSTYLIPTTEFGRVRNSSLGRFERLALLSDMCRLNTLSAVKRAGSGHLGSSFSATDIMVLLYHDLLNVRTVGVASPQRDVFLSSKGHDVPAQYSILHSLGILPPEKMKALRRLHGLEGHPNVQVPGIEANTGSLGMGIAKGRGTAIAKRLRGTGGRVVVMTGDGELQEGQIYESLQTASHHKVPMTVVVDHNKIQSDKAVCEIVDLGNLDQKLSSFGWHVERCNGHDFAALVTAFERCFALSNQPGVIIADTIKGKGVSFMEGPRALHAGAGTYRWHAGAPDDESYSRAHEEILARITNAFESAGLDRLLIEEEPLVRQRSDVSTEYVAAAFGERLLQLGEARDDLVVLDGDLAADCRVRDFEIKHPDRFIENGIAEQDMVSVAGALSRNGLLPVVNSFASFLSARANEQIYNNVTEGSKVIYACHFGGLIPAGPGPSHQSVRDISLFGALPGMTIVSPCNAAEARMLLDWCVQEATSSSMIRLAIGPSPRLIELPEGYVARPGRGATLLEGDDLLVLSYGPVLLHEVLAAAEALAKSGLRVRVVNMPWLNRFDGQWLSDLVRPFQAVVAVDDHSPVGGMGDALLRAMASEGILANRRVSLIGCEEVPVCGAPREVLEFHRLDAASLAARFADLAGSVGIQVDTSATRVESTVEADAPIG